MSNDHNQRPSALPAESTGNSEGPGPKRIGESPSFTPGPWEVWDGNRVVKHEKPGEAPRQLAETPGRTPEEGQDNARLMSAAPDLLSVAEEWVEYFDKLNRHADPDDPMVKARNMYHGERVERTRAAIAKAKGL